MLKTICGMCDSEGLEIGSNDKGTHVYIHCIRCHQHVDMFFDSAEESANTTIGQILDFYHDACAVLL